MQSASHFKRSTKTLDLKRRDRKNQNTRAFDSDKWRTTFTKPGIDSCRGTKPSCLSKSAALLCELLSDGLRNESYVYIEHNWPMLAQNGVLNYLFDRNIKRGLQSSVFMYVFTRRALTLSQNVRPVGKCLCKNLNEEVEAVDRVRDPLRAPFSFPEADSSLRKLSGDCISCKLAKNKQKARVEPDYLPIWTKTQKDCKQRRMKLSSSSGSFKSIATTSPPSDRESVGTTPKRLNA